MDAARPLLAYDPLIATARRGAGVVERALLGESEQVPVVTLLLVDV